jgi:hypothetical protein
MAAHAYDTPVCVVRKEADMAWLTLWLTTFAQRARNLAQRRDRPSPYTGAAGDSAPTQSEPPAPASSNDGTALVLAVFEQMTDAEQALSNLDEAGYEPHSISVIATDPTRTHTLTTRNGPLSSVPSDTLPARLESLGLSAADAEAYRSAIQRGDVVVAVSAPAGSADSAAEILSDEQAQQVTQLPGSAGRSRRAGCGRCAGVGGA